MPKGRRRISASGLLAAIKPVAEPITIPVGEGELQFRRLVNATEHRGLQVEARSFVKACERGRIPNAAGMDGEVLTAVWWLATLNICDPDAPADERTDSQQFWLQVAATGGAMVTTIYGMVVMELAGPLAASEMEELDSLGEDSSATPSGATTSP